MTNSIYVDEEVYQLSHLDIIHRHSIPVISRIPGIILTSCKQTYSFGSADVATAGLLNIPVNSPVGIKHRVIKDQHGNAIMLSRNLFGADIVTINIDVKI